ncbi:MAG: lysine exporter LysO family protein [Bacteroidales bacterium]
MKGSLIVVGFFALGCILGWAGEGQWLPQFLVSGSVTTYVLYLLMLQVGISIGSDKKLFEILCSIRPKLLLVPLATIVGTLTFSALVSLVLAKWSVFDCLAVGSGFAYYSLSSILITELKEASLGVQLAAELGTIALMANIMREVMALLFAPLFYKYFGKFAPISVGGATTMDTTLPIITKCCGKELVFVSIFHGVLVDFTVPLFVSFFCSL